MDCICYQFDRAGLFVGEAIADESPLEPGVFLLPARCTFEVPPASVPDDKWPRWNGIGWELVSRPQSTATQPDAAHKLADFLAQNPDVAALIGVTL